MLVLILAIAVILVIVVIILWMLSHYPMDPDSGGSAPPTEEGVKDIEPECEEEIEVVQPVVEGRQQKYRSKGEQACCEALEQIYGKPFRTVRPEWLVNPETGRRMELDCYNQELGIAVEYNGKQHYVWPNHLMKTEEQFLRQVKRDMLKVQLCDEHSVYLLTVPYTVPAQRIKEYLLRHLLCFT